MECCAIRPKRNRPHTRAQYGAVDEAEAELHAHAEAAPDQPVKAEPHAEGGPEQPDEAHAETAPEQPDEAHTEDAPDQPVKDEARAEVVPAAVVGAVDEASWQHAHI